MRRIGDGSRTESLNGYGMVVSRTPVYGGFDGDGSGVLEQTRDGAVPDAKAVRLIGFDVIYEYRGRRFSVRTASNPGTRIAIVPQAGRQVS